MRLNDEEKKRFFDDGYIVVRNLLSSIELEELHRHYEDLAMGRVPGYPENQLSVREVDGRAGYGQAHEDRIAEAIPHGYDHHRHGTQVFPKGEENFIEQRNARVQDPLDAVLKLNVPSRHDSLFDAWVRDPRIVDIIEDLMGPNIKLYYDQVFAKPPFDSANRYHQDSVFWSFFASNFQITVQVMFDDATVENGCLRFIPGSLDFGLIDWDHLPYVLTEDILEREVEIPLRAGDATFHHSLALHCSGPNKTPSRRRGWSIHYVSADTRYIGTPEQGEKIKALGVLEGAEPTNGWPLIRGREFPHCV